MDGNGPVPSCAMEAESVLDASFADEQVLGTSSFTMAH